MLVSIIIPVYNTEQYIARCLGSVINQTYRETEVIIINDGSTDQSLAMCTAFAGKDHRIKIISQKNKGLSAARNTGLANASGGYVTFIDSDDEIDPETLQSCMDAAKARPDIIAYNILQYRAGNNGCKMIRNPELPYEKILEKKQITERLFSEYYGGNAGILASACNKLYKRTFLQKNGLFFDESLKRSEDYWFNFEALKNAETFYAADRAFYHYYYTPGSMIKAFREDEYAHFLLGLKKLYEADSLLYEQRKRKIKQNFVENTNPYILLCYKNNRGDLAEKIFRDETYKSALKSYQAQNLHTKLIRSCQLLGLEKISGLLYRLWSKR